MIYITPVEIRGIIDTSLSDENIEDFISTAHLMVTSFLSNRGVVEDLLTEIKKYIAAHLIGASLKDKAVSSGAVLEEKIGDASVKYRDSSEAAVGGSFALSDLRSTRWGQTAIMLDPTGVLGTLGLPPPRMVSL
jgi:hypothetical protein